MNGDSYSSRDGGRQGGSRSYGGRDDRDRRRRRSRSPRHSSRRDYEVDTYSSSRDYREREREDTYARRERRDDRGWGDSYSRRDHPRRDDDRYGRRDRDGHEDRAERPDRADRGDRFERDRGDRGGRGRRGDRDRDAFGGRDRKKSQSPPFKKREPTPDLTNVVSILKRQRRMTQWDIKPAGYENITAEQAKLSGMFPLPGAPRAAPMDPSRLAAFMNPAAGSASASALKPENAKQAKRLFVHNIPAGATPESIVEWFNLQMNGLNVVSGNDPCLSAQINPNKEYALVEFKTPEDATMALTFDGVLMEDDPNNPDKPGMSIRRPKDYIVPVASSDSDDHMEGVPSSVVKDGPKKLSINHLLPNLTEEQLKEVLEVFGELKAFVLVQDTDMDPNNFQSRGVAFCEYANDDDEVLDKIIMGLSEIDLAGKKLLVKRACEGVAQAAPLDGGVNAISMLAGSTTDKAPETGRVLMLMNMVTHDELMDRETYEEIKEDVEEECAKFGKILDIKIPRPSGARTNPGVGKIYIKYEDPVSTQKAIKALAGRAFAGRTVVATHFSEELFDVDAW